MALKLKASDIHFNPRRHDVIIDLRINNTLRTIDYLPLQKAEKLISHFKFLSGMDIGEKRRPQNGAMDLYLSNELVHLRLSTLPSSFSESLVIRLLPQSFDLLLSDLSIFKEATVQLKSLLNYHSGLILISGPTGSGKTTTLYTMLATAQQLFNSRIVTLEDPVEKKNEAFIQMEINERADITYADGFKAVLRHDPDIIMVGEIRDSETARIAIRAALTGHLIFSTVHAGDAFSTIQRMLELGIPLFDLKETLVGIISQRLAIVPCAQCQKLCDPTCPSYSNIQRTGIFEILAGMPLHDVLIEGKRNPRSRYKKIDDYMRQGISSGLLMPDNSSEEPSNG